MYNYYLRRLLGVGRFGGVFLAEERVREIMLRELAVKLILYDEDDETNDQLNELKQATHLEHPHLVRAHTAGACELNGMDFLYLVMEKGEYSLQDRIQQQPLSIAETKTLIRHVAAALKYLHQQGKVHRDLKPGNVLWANSSWKLSDFGLIRSLGPQSYVQTASRAGTRVYMPPEAFDSKISPAWDIWSLGIIVVVALTGKFPYQFEDDNQLMKQVMAGNLQRPSLPGELQALVQGCLHRNLQERWTAQQVIDYLDGFKRFEFETAKLEIVKSNIRIERHSRCNVQWREKLPNGVTLEMVKIPGGTFLMGAAQREKNTLVYEYPQHSVTVPEFLMGKHPVTQVQWRAVAQLPQIHRPLALEPSEFKGDTRPVERVSWYDAIEFCARLSQATGQNYCLPSEAEWEYACRAGTTSPFSFGDTLSTDLANYDGNYLYGLGHKGLYRQGTTPVGSFPANGFGLYDMHGNLWEWCLDDWHDSYQEARSDEQPWFDNDNYSYLWKNWQYGLSKILQQNNPKLLRGGSWDDYPRNCRSASRYRETPEIRYRYIGFRVCCAVARTP
ncbi:bifunctional serine/threonine-protein kinase/formylglycine-generating enzyme family protein [Sodalinema gerasimenkoae]|uniref:bifunctional serine/threonine-protein kinase/formylglycine-generating enzyme family protein n=1 Tax=Sodalinema gerasimenkoae TaxID=2862348 RepID=UPI00135A8645|nr:bifunctional serine/threonine-protein kinase/formylglycine-generating enzyme family protein [Sodalinema gerasimenkoae]